MDSRDFLLTTDYPIDKIVGYNVGSLTIPAQGFNDIDVNHELDFIPLPYLRWSYSANFAESFEESFTPNMTTLISATARVGITEIRTLNTSSTPQTVHYRIIYLAPGGIVAKSERTQLDLDDFNINTDYNYPKLMYEGILEGPSDSFSHNLGFMPQVEAWHYNNNSANRYLGSTVDSFWSYRLSVTPTELIWQTNTSLPDPNRDVYYRIYGDAI